MLNGFCRKRKSTVQMWDLALNSGCQKFVRTKNTSKANAERKGTPVAKALQSKAQLLHKLNEAADAARSRVSSYTDDRRSHLEQLARGVIQSASTKQVCRR